MLFLLLSEGSILKISLPRNFSIEFKISFELQLYYHTHILNLLENASSGGLSGRIPIATDFNLTDSEGQSLLWLSLVTQQHDIAKILVDAGAYVDQEDEKGETLLHRSLTRKDVDATLFLLQNNANINKR